MSINSIINNNVIDETSDIIKYKITLFVKKYLYDNKNIILDEYIHQILWFHKYILNDIYDILIAIIELLYGSNVTVFMVNWRDTTMGSDVLMHGKIGQVSQEESTFKAELRGLANAYEQSIGQIIQPTCRATLGDSRCTVNLAPYTVTGILSGVSSTGLVLSDFTRTEPGPVGGKAISGITRSTTPTVTCTAHGFSAGSVIYIAQVLGMAEINGQFYVVKAVTTNSFTLGIDTTNFTAYSSGGTATVQGDAGYFDYGKITMTSGASIGLSMEVKAYSSGTITLQMQLPLGVASGDSYTLVAGCGKRFKLDCVTRFGNGINFRGEPFLPGLDKIMKAGTQ